MGAIDNVRAAEARRVKAQLDSDVVTLRELFAEEFVFVHSTGRIEHRQSFFDTYASRLPYTKLESKEERIIMQGDDLAVAISEVHWEAVRPDGTPRIAHVRVNAVWARRGDSWKMLTISSTPIQ